MQLTCDAAQVREDAARNQLDNDPMRTNFGDRLAYPGIEHIVACDGAIEVEGNVESFMARPSCASRDEEKSRSG